ncbi:MAG: GNAT family N-acetyltransferase [Sphingobacteriales bacterium]
MLPEEKVIIRDAGPDDLGEITLLMADLGYPTTVAEVQTRFNSIFVHPDYRTIVAVIGDEIVGVAGLCKGLYYEKNGLYLRILVFVVKQSRQGLGIGKILIKACEDWALEQGLGTILINSGNRDERRAAHAFYQKMGYDVKSSGFVKEL